MCCSKSRTQSSPLEGGTAVAEPVLGRLDTHPEAGSAVSSETVTELPHIGGSPHIGTYPDLCNSLVM
jgi:hypothetical protein